MAASDTNPRFDPSPPGVLECLGAGRRCASAWTRRSAAPNATAPGSAACSSVIENLDEMAREHGGELREQTVAYVAGALRRELRRFDRIGQMRTGTSPTTRRARRTPRAGPPGPADRPARRRQRARRDRGQARARALRTIKVEAGGAAPAAARSRSGSRRGAATRAPMSCSRRRAPPSAASTATPLRHTCRRPTTIRRRPRHSSHLQRALEHVPRTRPWSDAPEAHNLGQCSPDQSCGCCG